MATDFESELKGFEAYEEGWDGYGAHAPDARTINRAREAIGVLAQFGIEPQYLDANPNGSIAIVFVDQDRRYLALDVEGDRLNLLVKSSTGPMIGLVHPVCQQCAEGG